MMNRTGRVIFGVLAVSLLLVATAVAQSAPTIPWSAITGGGGSGVVGGVTLGSASLAPSGCPPEARVSVDGPLCPNSQAVTGRVTGTACGDAAVTIRHTAACDGINDLLVGVGRTTANGAFTVPVSETLHSGHMGCSEPALINVDVECSCGPLRVEKDVSQLPRFSVPLYIPVPQAGQTTLSGQWDSYCAGQRLPSPISGATSSVRAFSGRMAVS